MAKRKSKIVLPSEEEVSRYAREGGTSEENHPEQAPAEESGEATCQQAEAPEETLDSLRAQRDEYKERLLRAQAECANISKRLHQQHAEALKLAGMGLARALLPALDSFERMLASADDSSARNPFFEGVRLIADQLTKTLRDHGVEPIEALNRPFDPSLHEAVMQDRDAQVPPGTVTRELERGYLMHNRVLRPAKVAVAAAPSEEDSVAREAEEDSAALETEEAEGAEASKCDPPS